MNNNKNYSGFYASICLVLGMIFFGMLLLRLTRAVMIPWVWVFAPLWIPSCVIAIILGIVFLIVIVKDKILKGHYIVRELFDEHQ